jgi:hypothetical protein
MDQRPIAPEWQHGVDPSEPTFPQLLQSQPTPDAEQDFPVRILYTFGDK